MPFAESAAPAVPVPPPAAAAAPASKPGSARKDKQGAATPRPHTKSP